MARIFVIVVAFALASSAPGAPVQAAPEQKTPPAALAGSWKSRDKERPAWFGFEPERLLCHRQGRLEVFWARYAEQAIEYKHLAATPTLKPRIEAGLLTLEIDGRKYLCERCEQTPAELKLEPAPLGRPGELAAERVAAVRTDLARRAELDQQVRNVQNPLDILQATERMKKVDAENTAHLKKLIAEVGWIDVGRFGREASTNAFLLVQHSGDLALMSAVVAEIEKDVQAGRLRDGEAFALLFDRLALMSGGPQRYGTQIAMNEKSELVVPLLEDAANVDARRKKLKLLPLESYLVTFEAENGDRPVRIQPDAWLPQEVAVVAAEEAPLAVTPVRMQVSADHLPEPARRLQGCWRNNAQPEHLMWFLPHKVVQTTPGQPWPRGDRAEYLPESLRLGEPVRVWKTSLGEGKLTLSADKRTLEFTRLEAVPEQLLELHQPRPLGKPLPVEAKRVAAIRKDLTERFERDQAARRAWRENRNDETLAAIRKVDDENHAGLVKLLAEVGWLDVGRFGYAISHKAYVMLMHYPHDWRLMQAVLPELERDVKRGRFDARLYVSLHYRARLALGEPDRYGLVQHDVKTGKPYVEPVEDPKRVDEFRRELGLPPLAEELAATADLPAEMLERLRAPTK